MIEVSFPVLFSPLNTKQKGPLLTRNISPNPLSIFAINLLIKTKLCIKKVKGQCHRYHNSYKISHKLAGKDYLQIILEMNFVSTW